MLKIALDCNGPGGALRPAIEGALRAARELGLEVLLVGPEEPLRRELAALGAEAAKLGLSLLDAPQSVGAGEDPAAAAREKPLSSVLAAAQAAASGACAAMVTPAPRAAAVHAAVWHMKRLKGALKPALACPVPTRSGTALVVDAGANPDCKPWHLLQFGLMGSIYARAALGVAEPKVGLLCGALGESEADELTRETLPMMRFAGLSFSGLVDGRALVDGGVDVAVCAGSAGSLALSLAQGIAVAYGDMLESDIGRGRLSRVGGPLVGGAARRTRERFAAGAGGAVLLGVDGHAVLSSLGAAATGEGVLRALRTAAALAGSGTRDEIRARLEDMKSNLQFARAIE